MVAPVARVGPDLSPEPASNVRTSWPTLSDPVVRAGSEVLGGPAGRRVDPGRTLRGWAGPYSAAAAAAVLWATVAVMAGVVLRAHCRAEGWAGRPQYVHGCFAELPSAVAGHGIRPGLAALVAGQAGLSPQTPGTAVVIRVLTGLVPGLDGAVTVAGTRWLFDLTALLALASAVVLVVSLVRLAPAAPWRAAAAGAAVVLATAAVGSIALLPVALAVAGWAEVAVPGGRARLGGALLALASALSPLALVVPLALLAVRPGVAGHATSRRWLLPFAVLGTALWALSAAAVLRSVGGPEGLGAWLGAVFRPADGSLWFVPDLAAQSLSAATGTRMAGLPAVVGLALSGLGALATVGLAVRQARRGTSLGGGGAAPGVAEVGLLLTAGLLVTAPAVPATASLWLLPFAALAVPRWGFHLLWGAAEAVYFLCWSLYQDGLLGSNRGMPPGGYAIVLVVRLGAVLGLLAGVRTTERGPASGSASGPAVASAGPRLPADARTR